MTPADYSNRQFSRILSILRRPLFGSLLFGVVFGGIPVGITLAISWPQETVRPYNWALPVTIALAALSAYLSIQKNWYHILQRAFYTSLAIWIPIPALVFILLGWHMGLELSDYRNLPFNIAILLVFAVITTVPSWLLALVFENLTTR